MTTEEKKQATVNKLAETRKKRTKPANQIVTEMPLLKGDIITFKVPEKGCAGDLYGVETSNIEYDYILDSVGRKVSVRSLVGIRNNGIDIKGDNRDARCDNFLAMLDEVGEKSYKVANVRTLPSVRAEWSDRRIVNWEEA